MAKGARFKARPFVYITIQPSQILYRELRAIKVDFKSAYADRAMTENA